MTYFRKTDGKTPSENKKMFKQMEKSNRMMSFLHLKQTSTQNRWRILHLKLQKDSLGWRSGTFSITRQPSASLRPAKAHHILQGKALCAFVLVIAKHARRRKLSRAAFAVRRPAACPALDSFRRTAYPRRRRKIRTTSKSPQQIPVCVKRTCPAECGAGLQ